MGNQDLTVTEVAEELQMHPESIRRLLRDRLIPGYQFRPRGAWRVTRDALDAYKRFIYEGKKNG